MWYKGSIHIHTDQSDGELSPAAVCEMYLEQNYDFIAFTDHNLYTRYHGELKGLVLIENSIETHNLSDIYLHILGLGMQKQVELRGLSHQEKINRINAQQGISIICHPNWNWISCSFNKLLELNGYQGIEIVNALMIGEQGSHAAVEKWDYLLSFGRKIHGFAVDDLHAYRAEPTAAGWVMVQSPSLKQEDLIHCIKKGDFYSTTGVIIEKYEIRDGSLHVLSQNGQEIVFISDNGKIINVIDGDSASIPLDNQYQYIRCEVRSESGIAYMQPIFL